MPRGRAPTGTWPTCARLATSMTSTASPSSALTKTKRPSGENTACSGFLPRTLTTNDFALVRVSTKTISLVSSTAATTQRPSGERPTPSGEAPTAIVPERLRAARSTITSALFGWSLT